MTIRANAESARAPQVGPIGWSTVVDAGATSYRRYDAAAGVDATQAAAGVAEDDGAIVINPDTRFDGAAAGFGTS
jgi:hypothetical protein